MGTIEILAPAGSPESLVPAVRLGADAVYLGAKQFSARGNAGNFDREALKEAVEYCHIRGVKTVSYTHLDVYKRQGFNYSNELSDNFKFITVHIID